MKKFLKKTKNYISSSKRILGLYYKSNKKAFFIFLFTVIIVSIIPFANAYIFKLIIDKLVTALKEGQTDINDFIPLIATSATLSLLNKAAWKVSNYFERILYLDFRKYIQLMGQRKFVDLGFEHFADPKTNNLLNRVEETYQYRPVNFANRQIWTIQNLVEVIANASAVIFFNVWIFVGIIITAIPELIIKMKYGQDVWGIYAAKGDIKRDFWNTAWYMRKEKYLEEIRIFDSAKYLYDRLNRLYSNFLNAQKEEEKRKLSHSIISAIFNSLIFAMSEIYLVISAIAQTITIGSLNFYNGRIYRLSQAFNSLFKNLGSNYEDLLYINDFFKFIDLKNKVSNKKNAKKIKTEPKKIEFKNVFFKYPKQSDFVLKNFNLTINPHEKIALIGENGGGKTTIIRLLCRFFDVTKGEILIDGINIKDINLASWYKCLGVLFQDFNRYSFSVKNNIRIGDIDKEFEQDLFNTSLDKSQASDFVSNYDNGIDTRLSKEFEDGIEPSVGQWQKIALGRAFFRDAPILILDEPTASIDANSEAAIFQQLEKFEKNKTVIMISHRFSTVRNADKIYIIDDGKILESGTHQDLMKKEGKYAKLFKIQAKGYK